MWRLWCLRPAGWEEGGGDPGTVPWCFAGPSQVQQTLSPREPGGRLGRPQDPGEGLWPLGRALLRTSCLPTPADHFVTFNFNELK